MKEENKQGLKKLYQKLKTSGFIGIIFSSTLIKVIVFASSLFLPAFLSPVDFGIYTYSENLFNYFLLLNGLGISNSIIKFCSNNESNQVQKGYFLSCVKFGLLFDLLLSALMVVFCLFYKFEFTEAKFLLLSMLILPMFLFLFECIQFYLRSNFENNKFSILTFVYSFILLALQIGLVIDFSLTGVIVAKYVSLIFALLLGVYFLWKIDFFKGSIIHPGKEKLIAFFKYGVVMLISNFTSLIISLNDTYLVGSILKDSTVIAQYKVASLPLQLMLFFTNAIIVFILPHFIKHANDKGWVRRNFRKIMAMNFLLCLAIHIVMFIIAKPFVAVFYGEAYLNSVPLMYNFLIVSFVLSAIRNIPGNLLAVLGYEKYNLKINILSVVIHIVICYALLVEFGASSMGIALFVTYMISGIISLIKMLSITKDVATVK